MADIEKQAIANDNANAAAPVHGPGYGQPAVMLSADAARQAIYQGVAPTQFRKLANPAPLGLFSFASTTLILSLVNVNAHNVTIPNVVVGMALFVGGLCQLLAGMWEFAAGNTFGATAFSSYGGFWLAYATIFIPGSGTLAAYAGTDELDSAVGFFLAVWFIFTFIMLIGSLRSSIGLISLFFFLDLTFLFLTIGAYKTNPKINKAGGGFGIITAFIAYYCGAANLINREVNFFDVPLGAIPNRRD